MDQPLNPLLVLASSALAFSAVYLAARWIGPAWDQFSRRHIADISPRLQALGMDDSDVRGWLRWWGLAMFLTFFVLAVVLVMPPIAVGLTILVFISPRYVLDVMIHRRQIRLRDQLVRASVGLANTSRAGMSLAQGLEKISIDSPEPMATELRRIVRDYKAGRPLAQALREVRHRLDLEAFTVFASAVTVALERGGKITFALEQISEGLQEMQRLERKLEADSAAGKQLATVLAVFPIAFLAMFTLLDPVSTGYLYTTLVGQIILLIIGVMVFGAVKWCMSILDLDF